MSLQWVPTANAFELATEYGLIKFAEDLVAYLSPCSRVPAHISTVERAFGRVGDKSVRLGRCVARVFASSRERG